MSVVAFEHLGRDVERYPGLSPFGESEAGRHDSHDNVRFPAQSYGLSQHCGVRAETALLERMAEDDHLVFSRLLLFRKEPPAQGGRNAQHTKNLGRDLDRPELLRFSLTCEV